MNQGHRLPILILTKSLLMYGASCKTTVEPRITIEKIQSCNIIDIKSLIADLGFHIKKKDIEENLAYFKKHKSSNKCWGIKIENELVGIVAINILKPFYRSGLFARIDTIVVKGKYQSLGIGKKILEFIESYSYKKGYQRIFLTSGNHRVNAHAFFKANGFVTNATYFTKELSTMKSYLSEQQMEEGIQI